MKQLTTKEFWAGLYLMYYLHSDTSIHQRSTCFNMQILMAKLHAFLHHSHSATLWHSVAHAHPTLKNINMFHSQVPDAGFLLALHQFGMLPGGTDHLSPSHRFLQLHQPLLVLVALHQNPGHLHAGETLPLRHWHIILRRAQGKKKALKHQKFWQLSPFLKDSYSMSIQIHQPGARGLGFQIGTDERVQTSFSSCPAAFFFSFSSSSFDFLRSSSRSPTRFFSFSLTLCREAISSRRISCSLCRQWEKELFSGHNLLVAPGSAHWQTWLQISSTVQLNTWVADNQLLF